MQEDIDVLDEIDLEEDQEHTKKLVVLNDDVNTFDHVIKALVDICDHTFIQAEQCAWIVHTKGKCSVKEGTFEKLLPLKRAILDRGIGAIIE